MAKNHVLSIDVGGMKVAVIREDGSLIIMARKTLSDFTVNDWDIVVEIMPGGVKNLKDMLERDAQQRTEAETTGIQEASYDSPFLNLYMYRARKFLAEVGKKLLS